MPHPFQHLEDSLSASKISSYLRCPLQFYFDRVAKIPRERISAAMLFGSATDSALKNALVSFKQGRDSVTPEEFFVEAFEAAVEKAAAPISWPKRYDYQGMLDLGQGLVEALGRVLLTEERVERLVGFDVPFTIPLVDDEGQALLDVPVVGILDFVERFDGRDVPLELKTSASKSTFAPTNLERDVQCLIYAMAARLLQPEGEAEVHYLVGVRTKSPQVLETQHRVTDDQLRWVRGLAVAVKRAIDSELYFPAPSIMSCGGCSHTEACAKSGGVALCKPKRIFSAALGSRPAGSHCPWPTSQTADAPSGSHSR